MKLRVTDNKQFLHIEEATELEIEQLQISLKKRTRNYNFKKKLYQKWNWDGYTLFLDRYNRIPFGLWSKVQDICEKYNFECNLENMESVINTEFDEDAFDEWIKEFFKDHPKITPYDYQIEAAKKILKWRRCISELATSAGKTLIVFIIFAWLKYNGLINKMLMIVPKVSLVTQGVEDFEDYSQDKKKLKFVTQMIGGGRAKDKKNVDFIVGTFQTLSKLPKTFFEGIDVVCVDEGHQTDTKSVKKVLKMCIDADMRFGLSGTMMVDDETSESYTILSLLGPMVHKLSPLFLTKYGYATPIKIKMILMDYLDVQEKDLLYQLRSKRNDIDGKQLLVIERQVITENKKRLKFITAIISKVSKNSLVLFNDIKGGYGKRIVKVLKHICGNNYDIFYVDGSTDEKIRATYKRKMNLNDGKVRILVASFGTFSTGISINNIHNIFFTESYRSEKIIKQSIGRGMRLMDEKDVINIIDFVDDFSYKGLDNYVLRHSYSREEIYLREGFNYKKIRVEI